METLPLNLLNFESLIATKASRVRAVAGDRMFVDFRTPKGAGRWGNPGKPCGGYRGADATSTVWREACMIFPLAVPGTSLQVQGFEEVDAFREFVRHFPERSILLVDTYDTLKSGIPECH